MNGSIETACPSRKLTGIGKLALELQEPRGSISRTSLHHPCRLPPYKWGDSSGFCKLHGFGDLFGSPFELEGFNEDHYNLPVEFRLSDGQQRDCHLRLQHTLMWFSTSTYLCYTRCSMSFPTIKLMNLKSAAILMMQTTYFGFSNKMFTFFS